MRPERDAPALTVITGDDDHQKTGSSIVYAQWWSKREPFIVNNSAARSRSRRAFLQCETKERSVRRNCTNR